MDGFSISNLNRFQGVSNGSLDGKSIKLDTSNSEMILPGGNSTGAEMSFSNVLKGAIDQVNALQKDSDKKIQDLATGRTENIADVMIAAEKADIALKVMVQVRNKIVDAYNEIMKMQV